MDLVLSLGRHPEHEYIDFARLRPGAWLNDEIINVYITILGRRDVDERKLFILNSFFLLNTAQHLRGLKKVNYQFNHTGIITELFTAAKQRRRLSAGRCAIISCSPSSSRTARLAESLGRNPNRLRSEGGPIF